MSDSIDARRPYAFYAFPQEQPITPIQRDIFAPTRTIAKATKAYTTTIIKKMGKEGAVNHSPVVSPSGFKIGFHTTIDNTAGAANADMSCSSHIGTPMLIRESIPIDRTKYPATIAGTTQGYLNRNLIRT